MAISVDTVYKTVLLILNKEQRGYMTPDEFNKIAAQVQLEIFEKYFEDLNQTVRSPQTDADYADRVAYLEEKISVFKKIATQSVSNGVGGLPDNLHRLNTITYNDIECQRLGRNEYYNIIKSPLTKPTASFPIYLQEGASIKIEPTSISSVQVSYVSTPTSPNWDFQLGTVGQYIFKSVGSAESSSVNFDLHASEQTEVILRILAYAGIIIRDSQIVQAAAAQVQQQNINEKS
jgi:hypothetical protein